MKIDANLHADEWKSGTEALALCMICGGEYAPSTHECPNCKVSLSVVRRCPSCHKIVSAQHTKCVYCRTPFLEELPKRHLEDFTAATGGGVDPTMRRFRAAAVSITTFLVVFSLGMFFLRMISKPVITIQVIAKAYMVHSALARRAPTPNSSNLGKIIDGTVVNITGYQETDTGPWMTLDLNNTVAYVPAADISSPIPTNSEGANALKFHISGMQTAESAGEATSAVEQFVKAFPGDQHIDELKFALAERLRIISQHGGARGSELRLQSTQLFEELAAGNGSFAEKARIALAPPPSAHSVSRARTGAPSKKKGFEIIGGSGTSTSMAPTGPREVLIH